MTSQSVNVSGAALRQHPTREIGRAIALALVFVLVAVIASLLLGTRVTSWSEFTAGVTGSTGTVAEAAVAARVPRTALALLVGAMLAMSGASLQAVTRNPLADPGILGISFGASLAIVVGIAFFGISSPGTFMVTALAGASVTAVFVYAVGSVGFGGASPMKLALAGAATAAACAALISAILLPRVDIIAAFRHWQIGGVGGAGWDRILSILPMALIGGSLCLILARAFNALSLGDEAATGLGARVGRTRLLGWAGAVILCGAATSAVGPIAFVGLVIPHVARLLSGPDYRHILPLSIAMGAGLLITADVIGRVIARPQEVEVGIVIALIGAPFFVWLVRRQKVREL